MEDESFGFSEVSKLQLEMEIWLGPSVQQLGHIISRR